MSIEIRKTTYEPRRGIYYAMCCRIWPMIEYPPFPIPRGCGYCGETPYRIRSDDPMHPSQFEEWKEWRLNSSANTVNETT